MVPNPRMHIIHYAALVACDDFGNQIEKFAQLAMRGILVFARQSAVTDYVDVENGGKLAR